MKNNYKSQYNFLKDNIPSDIIIYSIIFHLLNFSLNEVELITTKEPNTFSIPQI
jgi:hypothetical protein